MGDCKKKRCSFRDCNSASKKDPSLKFYLFSKLNLEKWVEACENDALNSLSSKVITSNRYVCEMHFKNEDFAYILAPFKKRLKPTAIPRKLLEQVESVSSSSVKTTITTTSTSNFDSFSKSQKPIQLSSPSNENDCDDIDIMKMEIIDNDDNEEPMDISSKLETNNTINEKEIDLSSDCSNQPFLVTTSSVGDSINTVSSSEMHLKQHVTSISSKVGKKRKTTQDFESIRKSCKIDDSYSEWKNAAVTNALSQTKTSFVANSSKSIPLKINTALFNKKRNTVSFSNMKDCRVRKNLNSTKLPHKNVQAPSGASLEQKSTTSYVSMGKKPNIFFVCSVRGCLSTSNSNWLYSLPSEPDHASKWLSSLHEKQLEQLLKLNGSVPSNYLVCEKHFEDRFFKKGQFGKKLNKAGIPTKHLPSSANNAEEYVTDEEASPSATYSDVEDATSEIILPDHTKVPIVCLDQLKSCSISAKFCYHHKVSLSSAWNVTMELKKFEQCLKFPHLRPLKWQVSELHKLQTSRLSRAILRDLTRSESNTTLSNDVEVVMVPEDDDDQVSQSVDSISGLVSSNPVQLCKTRKQKVKEKWVSVATDPSISNSAPVTVLNNAAAFNVQTLTSSAIAQPSTEAPVVQLTAANNVKYYLSIPANMIFGGGSNGSVLTLPPIQLSALPSFPAGISSTTTPVPIAPKADTVQSTQELDEKLSKALVEDIRRLKSELELLNAEKRQRYHDLHSIARNLRTYRLPRYLFCHEKQAFKFCKLKISETALKFFMRQLLHINQPRWEYNSSSVLPLLMLQSNNNTRKVAQSLYKLPSMGCVLRIKKRLRKNPSVLGNCPIMTELIKRQRVEYRPPRVPKKWTVSNSVAEYLEKFMQGNET